MKQSILVIMVCCLVGFTSYAVSSEYMAGQMAGRAAAGGFDGGAFFTGFFFGGLGVVYVAVTSPSVPFEMSFVNMNQSAAYQLGFNEGYRSTKQSNRLNGALLGWFTGLATILVMIGSSY